MHTSPKSIVPLLLLLLLLLLLPAFSSAAPADDEVVTLPGWDGPLPSRHYSGYLRVAGGTNLHYYLVQSERAPLAAPTVVWLNGGPGCSSLDGWTCELLLSDPNERFRLTPTAGTRWARSASCWRATPPALPRGPTAGTAWSTCSSLRRPWASASPTATRATTRVTTTALLQRTQRPWSIFTGCSPNCCPIPCTSQGNPTLECKLHVACCAVAARDALLHVCTDAC